MCDNAEQQRKCRKQKKKIHVPIRFGAKMLFDSEKSRWKSNNWKHIFCVDNFYSRSASCKWIELVNVSFGIQMRILSSFDYSLVAMCGYECVRLHFKWRLNNSRMSVDNSDIHLTIFPPKSSEGRFNCENAPSLGHNEMFSNGQLCIAANKSPSSSSAIKNCVFVLIFMRIQHFNCSRQHMWTSSNSSCHKSICETKRVQEQQS